MTHIADSPNTQILSPSPPTSEKPDYRALYTSIHALNDDVFLEIFNHFRLDDEWNWNLQRRWCKLSHVCRRWRSCIYDSPSLLNMHILLRNGTPNMDLVAHLPPLPLVIDYRDRIAAEDEETILPALQQRDRIRHMTLQVPSRSLYKLLMTMDGPFPSLESISLLSTTEEHQCPTLPGTFLAPNLRHVTFVGVGFPPGLPLLASAFDLVTLTLTHTQASGYIFPELLITHLQHLIQLEDLSIGFSIPLPRPNDETKLLRGPIIRVTIPSLKRLTFRGVAAYLESLIARIRAPLLEQLNIALFNQLAYTLPRLSHFTSSTEGLRHHTGQVIFSQDVVSILVGPPEEIGEGGFGLHISCKQFDWQIDSAVQVFGELRPMLSIVEELTLGFGEDRTPSVQWQTDAVESIMWHELLLPFSGVKKLRVGSSLAPELSSALDPDDAGLALELLPELEEIEAQLEDEGAYSGFAAFVDARRVAGRPVLFPDSMIPPPPPAKEPRLIADSMRPPPPPKKDTRLLTIADQLHPTEPPQHILTQAHPVSPPGLLAQINWFTRGVVGRVRRQIDATASPSKS